MLFRSLSAILVPQLSVSDENMHYLRAYGISQGRVESGLHCTLPKDVAKRAGSVYEGNFSADYSKPIDRNTLDVDKCSSASGYPPIMHLPQAVGINRLVRLPGRKNRPGPRQRPHFPARKPGAGARNREQGARVAGYCRAASGRGRVRQIFRRAASSMGESSVQRLSTSKIPSTH